jgi:hypothetical protein
VSFPVFAQNAEDFTVTQGKDGTVIITGYKGDEKDVTIPTTINGVEVTGVADKAFRNRALTGVTLPETLVSIGTLAFADNELTEIAFPSGLREIGVSAFANNKLRTLVMPDTVTVVRFSAFSRNPIDRVTISSQVRAVQPRVFDRAELSAITIGTDTEIYIRNFEKGFVNYYESKSKQAGTYVKKDGVWAIQ